MPTVTTETFLAHLRTTPRIISDADRLRAELRDSDMGTIVPGGIPTTAQLGWLLISSGLVRSRLSARSAQAIEEAANIASEMFVQPSARSKIQSALSEWIANQTTF